MSKEDARTCDTGLNRFVRLAELRRKLEDPAYLDEAIDAVAEKLAKDAFTRVKK